MSGAAGGGVVVLAAVAVAAPAVVAAGVAVGIAAGVNFAVDSISSAWEERERLVDLQRRQMQIKEGRFRQYNAAVAAFQEAAELAASVGIAVPDLPVGLTADNPLEELQDAMVRLHTTAAKLQREHEAAATLALTEATRTALKYTSTAEAQSIDEEIAEAQERVTAAEAKAGARIREAELEAVRVRARAVADRTQTLQARYQERVADALALIPADIDARARQRIDQWITQIPNLSGQPLEAAVIDLETICGRAASDAARRAHDDESAAAVLTALAGCYTPTALEISRRATEYLEGRSSWDPELPSKARAELERITRELESLAAAEILAESFLELGFEIGPEFETSVVARGGAFVHHADWGDTHALQVEIGADERISLQVVREGDPAAVASSRERAEDSAAEQRLCDRLQDIVEETADHGLRIDIDMRIDPGDEEVVRVRDTGRGTRRVRQVAKDREQAIRED